MGNNYSELQGGAAIPENHKIHYSRWQDGGSQANRPRRGGSFRTSSTEEPAEIPVRVGRRWTQPAYPDSNHSVGASDSPGSSQDSDQAYDYQMRSVRAGDLLYNNNMTMNPNNNMFLMNGAAYSNTMKDYNNPMLLTRSTSFLTNGGQGAYTAPVEGGVPHFMRLVQDDGVSNSTFPPSNDINGGVKRQTAARRSTMTNDYFFAPATPPTVQESQKKSSHHNTTTKEKPVRRVKETRPKVVQSKPVDDTQAILGLMEDIAEYTVDPESKPAPAQEDPSSEDEAEATADNYLELYAMDFAKTPAKPEKEEQVSRPPSQQELASSAGSFDITPYIMGDDLLGEEPRPNSSQGKTTEKKPEPPSKRTPPTTPQKNSPQSTTPSNISGNSVNVPARDDTSDTSKPLVKGNTIVGGGGILRPSGSSFRRSTLPTNTSMKEGELTSSFRQRRVSFSGRVS
ncbi:hypothetical protein ADEAN_000109100 [Angomonas deanei]|uniref:Uncharacterized protein n=1 Tax=Angomonas deanei TaxID=59799 RepID=A0A7G2C1K7_9TRYP|nr:hypothetical protein ADEAN_000109100 [Angomonas deanei]